jgi:hypothetical protein
MSVGLVVCVMKCFSAPPSVSLDESLEVSKHTLLVPLLTSGLSLSLFFLKKGEGLFFLLVLYLAAPVGLDGGGDGGGEGGEGGGEVKKGNERNVRDSMEKEKKSREDRAVLHEPHRLHTY